MGERTKPAKVFYSYYYYAMLLTFSERIAEADGSQCASGGGRWQQTSWSSCAWTRGCGKWSPLWGRDQGPLSKQRAGALPAEKGRRSTRDHGYLLRCTQPWARGFAAGSAQDSCDVGVDRAEELMLVALRGTLQGISFADYVEVDTCASVCGALTDEDIIVRAASAQPVAEEPEALKRVKRIPCAAFARWNREPQL
ncbi:hypothetical protein HPB52_024427 [Rhipicephalus sanguineus]|uniref:Uncharacterized protein n=1 Tax=Rhipicephalus sanguineus TaxID=34632 RepID=A0A9D4PAI6_RHISA|nr:hypothetical protein HPB52_024427 [Rhipicephalus sanguineus]